MSDLVRNPNDRFSHNMANFIIGGQFWVGGNDIAEERVWTWATSKTPVATGLSDWGSGQPDNADKDENCLTLNYHDHWNDQTCHSPQKYICEMVSGYVPTG